MALHFFIVKQYLIFSQIHFPILWFPISEFTNPRFGDYIVHNSKKISKMTFQFPLSILSTFLLCSDSDTYFLRPTLPTKC